MVFLKIFSIIETDFEKKIWLVNSAENSEKLKIKNDILIIDSFTKKDYGTYSCLFIDKFGQKKIDFTIDQNLIPADDIEPSTELSYLQTFDKNAQQELKINLSFSGGLSDGFLRITCESSKI